MCTANETPSLSARMTRLLHPAFLIALGLLLANDWLFKPMLHNALTGKLSDVAGVFTFAYFWSVLAGRKHAAIHVLVGIAFAIWKSPLSQPAIDVWNALRIMPIARVVDAGDLIALLVLPLSWRIVSMPHAIARSDAKWSPTTQVAKLSVACIALVAFVATSEQSSRISMEADYVTAYTAERITQIVEAKDDDALSAYGESLSVDIDIKDCGRGYVSLTGHTHGTDTVLRVYRLEAHCAENDIERDAVLAALDKVLGSSLKAHRVKVGVGAVGPALTLATPPAGQCPPDADTTSNADTHRSKPNSESTYPPKTRLRPQRQDAPRAPAEESQPAESTPADAITAPAAFPETPSPSAARNSN
jgi:hypothetical protein